MWRELSSSVFCCSNIKLKEIEKNFQIFLKNFSQQSLNKFVFVFIVSENLFSVKLVFSYTSYKLKVI